jgi:sugar (pentulose or hexulose) kinase
MSAKQTTGNEVLAIDAGTQGISVVLWCPDRKALLGVGEAKYAHDYIPGLPNGRLEQSAGYWSDALAAAMKGLRDDVRARGGGEIGTVAGIGVTGHMHCMVRLHKDGSKPFGCDMWNDPRGTPESVELTELLGEHIPARWTASHIHASLRDAPQEWKDVAGVSVTSGSLVHDLTGEWVLGPGDASGMFGVLGGDGQIDRAKLARMDEASGGAARPLAELVPRVVPAGEVAGRLNAAGSELLGGLPEGVAVAAPEGDQQSVLVGAAADELELALSAGTSFTGNIPSHVHLKAENETINVLHTPDALTMLMVCARNGTVGFAQYCGGLAELAGVGFGEMADRLTDLAAALPADAYGVELLPFFQGENVAELPHARASVHNAGLELVSNPGLMARLLLEGPCMTMRYGIEQLRPKIGDLRRVILTGGALKSKGGYAPQMYADILGVPVVARAGDEEGTAKGAAILAAYMAKKQAGEAGDSLAAFARTQIAGEDQAWTPREAERSVFDTRYEAFARLVEAARREAAASA